MPVYDWLSLNHLDRMTDSTGLIQHAIFSIPRRESGYTTDDNARALRLCTRLWCHDPDDRMLSRITVYLSFLEHARCPVRGFHNFLSYQRDWLDAAGTGDCQGQAVRALAEVLGSNLPDGYRALARELIDSVLPALTDLRSFAHRPTRFWRMVIWRRPEHTIPTNSNSWLCQPPTGLSSASAVQNDQIGNGSNRG